MPTVAIPTHGFLKVLCDHCSSLLRDLTTSEVQRRVIENLSALREKHNAAIAAGKSPVVVVAVISSLPDDVRYVVGPIPDDPNEGLLVEQQAQLPLGAIALAGTYEDVSNEILRER